LARDAGAVAKIGKDAGLSIIRSWWFALLFIVAAAPQAAAQDLEVEAWPEFDIWIPLDKQKKDRIYILAAFGSEPDYRYEESALGVSWDRRFHPNWSWRIGARYIWKVVDPPDANETRVVLDLKWTQPLGKGWQLSDRNRIDLRRFDTKDSASFRYRNRIQMEKTIPIFSRNWVTFGSYEMYYDSRYDKWGQRNRFIGGVSVPIVDWFSVDVFYGYHVETKPKSETGGAVGVALGIFLP
jgi:hypothetical protein